jgi:ubiquinone/menaquinone biosynthesis C-methylase UbiE
VNSPKSGQADLATREADFYDARSTSYDVIRYVIGRAVRGYSRYDFMASLYDPADKEVLDYGCGTGQLSASLLDRGARRVTGFDISQGEVDKARERFSGTDFEGRASFRVTDAHSTGFDDAEFDLIIGTSILHHLDLDRALPEIHRILRPGGRAIFVEPLEANPLLRIGRRLTPSARTTDEHPLTTQDWDYCQSLFGVFQHQEKELISVFLMPLNVLLPRFLQTRLARLTAALDRKLLRIFPKLRKYARVSYLVFGRN